jgi:hypothetical protein
MESSTLSNNKNLLSRRLPLALVLVIALINLSDWIYRDRTDYEHLLVGVGFLLCAPHMFYAPRGLFPANAPMAKAPSWAVAALVVGLVLVVSGFVVRWL